MDLKYNFRNTIRLSEALEELNSLLEERDNSLTIDELIDRVKFIIDDYKQCSITDEEYEFLSEDWGDD